MKKLLGVATLNGQIEVISGLRVGGCNDDIRIGGIDSEVVKHPITLAPYIPGSSLKGKMRSLLEQKYGRYRSRLDDQKRIIGREEAINGEPCQCGNRECLICQLFGAHKNTRSLVSPPRLIVRDCIVSVENKMGEEFGDSYYEKKAENCINRNTGTAESPRFMERVVPGVLFDYSIVLSVFEGDNVAALKKTVEEGLALIQDNYLGGRGSAGCGQVVFNNLTNWQDSYKETNNDEAV